MQLGTSSNTETCSLGPEAIQRPAAWGTRSNTETCSLGGPEAIQRHAAWGDQKQYRDLQLGASMQLGAGSNTNANSEFPFSVLLEVNDFPSGIELMKTSIKAHEYAKPRNIGFQSYLQLKRFIIDEYNY
jgi:hypothetical protein